MGKPNNIRQCRSRGMVLICLSAMLAVLLLLPVPVYAVEVRGMEAEPTLSGNELPVKNCTCKEKCNFFLTDINCPLCREEYRLCSYAEPNVVITIQPPKGWYNRRAKVRVSVTDALLTGHFVPVKIEAKIGHRGTGVDITAEKEVEISENCTLYVTVTDQKGKVYEANKAIHCFDRTGPVLNAAVSNGLLSIQAEDREAGVKSVYINGYAFEELTGDTLNVRLEQFDAGYEYFSISAMDGAGNMSEVYQIKNPYYKSSESGEDEEPAEQLPVSAGATRPGSATAIVTEHTKEQVSAEEAKKAELAKADALETSVTREEQGKEKEFYTITAASGKVFYLVIDRRGEEELVYFLTEVTEQDLLNVTSGNSEILPKNSAALESGILPLELEAMEDMAEVTEPEKEAVPLPEQPESGEEPLLGYVVLAGLAVAVMGVAYYLKFVRKKKEDFVEDEDEEEEEMYETEEEEEEDFFRREGEE